MNDRGTFQADARTQGSDLGRHAFETIALLPEVEELVTVVGTQLADHGGKPSKRAVFPAPWNTPAGNLVTTIGEAARDHELNLCLLLFSAVRYRGRSDTNTWAAIVRLPTLVAAAVRAGHVEHQYVAGAVLDLTRWPVQLRRFLDHVAEPGDPERWTRAPGGLVCPHCEHRLWLRPGWQHDPEGAPAYCRRCRDDEGRSLYWPPSSWLAVLQHADT